MPKLPISSRYTLDKLLSYAGQAPGGSEEVPSHILVRMIRHRLGMSQTQLAKRAGLPQSYIANIENGKTDLRASTLRKIFKALYCDIVILPRPAENLENILQRQVTNFVRRKISRVSGAMSRDQSIPSEVIQDLVSKEETKLMESPGSEIWDD